ncbi:hypothetical protein RND71_017781 [Anisodus tanguticus]|uniref:Uncharacterized protein n=1 Tax=Anisodus tanguticus TaxID=243964 RepID=A0AAE1S321_9SOLA|nr:hypothetical protein RND71_017781 [Anisodus tanguticus]
MELPSYSFLVPLLVFIFSLHKWFFSTSNTQERLLPPCPRKLPIIGNVHQLGSHRHCSLHKLSEKYGPVMLLHLGSKPVLVASSVEAARIILKTHDLVCSSRPKSSIADRLLYGSKDVAFSPNGKYLRQIKSVIVLHLLSNKRVQSYRNGGIGRTYNEEESGIEVTTLLEELLALLGIFNIGDYIPWFKWVNKINGLDIKLTRVAEDLDTFLESVIEEHTSRNKKGEYPEGEAKDFVDIFLEIQNGNETESPLQRDSLKAILSVI